MTTLTEVSQVRDTWQNSTNVYSKRRESPEGTEHRLDRKTKGVKSDGYQGERGGNEQDSRMGVAGMPNSRFPIKWVTLRCFAGATTVKGKMGRKKNSPPQKRE